MPKKTGKTDRLVQLRKILAGIDAHLPAVKSITLGGVPYTRKELVELIQQDLAMIDASAKAKAAYLTQIQVERNTHAKVSPVLRFLKAYVIVQFGDAQDAMSKLEDFGYSPRRVGSLTVAEKAGAQEKARATRDARRPSGKKSPNDGAEQSSATPPAASSPAMPNGHTTG
jgi:hypothetical protein